MSTLAPPIDVEMTETSWRPLGEMTFEQWEAAGRELQRMARAWQWWVGDWILYGEHYWGETYAQAIDLTGMEYQTLANTVSVARHIESSRRRENLTWTHHAEVAALPVPEQDAWLARADEEGMTTARLRSVLQAKRAGRPEPGDEPLAPTHRITITALVAAIDDEDAHAKACDLVDRLERAGASVTHKQVHPA